MTSGHAQQSALQIKPITACAVPIRCPRCSMKIALAWAIVGGESGPGARTMRREWATGIRDLCQRDGVAFFFKQWGGPRPKSGGRLLDGREWNEVPWGVVPETGPAQGRPA